MYLTGSEDYLSCRQRNKQGIYSADKACTARLPQNRLSRHHIVLFPLTMILNLYHDGLGVWEKWSRNDRGEDLMHLRTRDAVHYDLEVQTTRSTVRHTRNRMPES